MADFNGYGVEATTEPEELPAFNSFVVGFGKLLDRERNFLLLLSGIDNEPLRPLSTANAFPARA